MCRERDSLRAGLERVQTQVAGAELKEKMNMVDLDKLTKEVS